MRSTSQLTKAFDYVAGQLSTTDPALAAQWTIESAHSDITPKVLVPILDEWLRNDSMAASQWVASEIKDTAAREVAAATVVGFLIDAGDYSDSAVWIGGMLGDSEKRGPLMKSLVTRWAKADPEGAVVWVRSLANPDERDALLEVLEQRLSSASGSPE